MWSLLTDLPLLSPFLSNPLPVVDYFEENKDMIMAKLKEHGAVLFRVPLCSTFRPGSCIATK